jgi:hypothetical protein
LAETREYQVKNGAAHAFENYDGFFDIMLGYYMLVLHS